MAGYANGAGPYGGALAGNGLGKKISNQRCIYLTFYNYYLPHLLAGYGNGYANPYGAGEYKKTVMD